MATGHPLQLLTAAHLGCDDFLDLTQIQLEIVVETPEMPDVDDGAGVSI